MTPVATVATYRDLLDAFRSRARALKVSRSELGEAMGISWADKALTDPPIKHMSLAMGTVMLQALGLRMILIDDPDARRHLDVNGTYKLRGSTLPHRERTKRMERRIIKRFALSGARAMLAKLTAEQMSENSRRGWRTRRRNERARKRKDRQCEPQLQP
jgi:hypothetical protein